jgi:hypothetical protein
MAQIKISEAGVHGAVANTDRIPASVGPFTPGTRGYHEVASLQAKFNVYSNAASTLAANNFKAAIDEIDGKIIAGSSAANTTYSNTSSQLNSNNVQGALDHLDTRLDAITGDYIPLSYLDTDETLAANSDVKVASQQAVKVYVDQIIAAQDAMVFQGVIDASANPNYPAASRGHTYRISVAGKIGGASGANVEAGDLIICLTDSTSAGNQATVGTSWTIAQTNLDGAVIGPASSTDADFAQFDGVTGKLLKGGLSLDNDNTLAANSATRVPTQQAVKIYVDVIADALDGRITAVEGDYIPLSYLDTDDTLAANSDAKVPSQQAVKAYIDALISASDAMVYRGTIDASSNPNYPAGDAGDTYRISVAGRIGGASGPIVQAGDMIICTADETASGDHATVGSSWNIIQVNIDGAVVGPASATDSHFAQFDGTSGKLIKGGIALDNDALLAANSATRLATQQAVKVYVDDAIDSVGGSPDAEDVSYANAASTLAAANVQGAIDELDGKIEGLSIPVLPTQYAAANITYSNTGSTLASANVQDAIDEIDTKVEGLIAAADAMVFKGVIDCSADPNYPAADRGDTYRVSVAGQIGGGSGPNVEVGDLLLCLTDSTVTGDHATVGANWSIAQTNLDGAVIGPASSTDNFLPQWDGTSGKLLKAGVQLDNDSTLAANSASRVATQQAVKVYADTKEPLGETIIINSRTANYTLALVDKGAVVEVANDTSANVTVPNNDNVAFPTKSRIDLVQTGAGQIRIVADTGVTIRSKGDDLYLSEQWSGASLYKRGTNEWVLIGDLTTP